MASSNGDDGVWDGAIPSLGVLIVNDLIGFGYPCVIRLRLFFFPNDFS